MSDEKEVNDGELTELEKRADEEAQASREKLKAVPQVTTPDTSPAPATAPPTPPPAPVASGKGFEGNDRRPCYWNITKTETGIDARNSLTGNIFKGTVEEFNAKLRG